MLASMYLQRKRSERVHAARCSSFDTCRDAAAEGLPSPPPSPPRPLPCPCLSVGSGGTALAGLCCGYPRRGRMCLPRLHVSPAAMDRRVQCAHATRRSQTRLRKVPAAPTELAPAVAMAATTDAAAAAPFFFAVARTWRRRWRRRRRPQRLQRWATRPAAAAGAVLVSPRPCRRCHRGGCQGPPLPSPTAVAAAVSRAASVSLLPRRCGCQRSGGRRGGQCLPQPRRGWGA